MTWPRAPFTIQSYVQLITNRDYCFICELVDSEPPTHEVVYRDGQHIAFLNRYPALEGHLLVAPLEHREQAIGDFSLGEYLDLQTLIHRIGRALMACVPTERIYVLSLGSQLGNSHVHWHIAPLPPGIPFQEQQFLALTIDSEGYLDIPSSERARFVAQLQAEMGEQD